MDKVDRELLRLINTNAKMSNSEIAKHINMTSAGVAERIKKLEKNNILKGYETRIDHKACGLNLTTFILVKSNEPVGVSDAGRKLAELEEVQEVHYLTGSFCYLLKVRVESTDALTGFLQRVGKIDHIQDTRTMLALETLKESLSLKL
jgi:Lrp/AsnC family leucine-responsive transcriptional regulator